MRTNYHTHTTRCLHATGSDEEFVLSAIKGGYQELGFSDHTPWKYHTDYVSDIRMTPEELPEYVESLRSLQKKYKDQISIKIGLECEYFPEYIPWLKGVIKEYQLDYIIFGNHHFHTDEKFPYFGRNTHTVDMLERVRLKGWKAACLPIWHIPTCSCVHILNSTVIVNLSADTSAGQQPA